MTDLLTNPGTGISAAGDLLGGIGSFAGSMSSADKLKAAATRENYATAVRLAQQQRQGYQVQGRAEADIGASGGTMGGSAEDILRSNAQQLSLEHGIIQQQGSEQASQYTTAASGALASGWGSLISGVAKAGATALL